MFNSKKLVGALPRQGRGASLVFRAIGLVAAVFLLYGVPAQAQTLPYDHMHISVPDPAKAADWYIKYMGGTKASTPTQVFFGPTLFMFRQAADAKPSEGSVIDHVGFSFADLDAKMAELQAAGTKVVTPARDVPGLFKLAFVEDPWGTKIELVQDAETPGFHHIHLRAVDPEAMMKWLSDSFGGERAKLKNRIDALLYQKIWVLIQKAPAAPAPSAGNVIDHLGWKAADLDATAAALKAKGVTFTTEPRAAGALKISFVEGPDKLRVEVLQRP